jgi:serine/threonine-protein kinase RsbW
VPETGSGQHIDHVLDSSLESVDRAEELVLRAATEMGFDEDNQHRIGIAVREAMVNAVAHGNRYSAKKKVHLTLGSGADRLEIRIADEGDGFETGSVPDPTESENLMRQSGRGLLMMRAFMDEVFHVRREPKGTAVHMVKYRQPGEGNS